MEEVDLYQYEKELWEKGISFVAGVDEVWRGPLIGPVVTACVVLPHDFALEGLTDSKKISEKKRNQFYQYIMDHAVAVEIGMCTPEEIDTMNIYQASKEAMIRAITKVREKVDVKHVLSDAMPMELDIPVTPIIKGDAKSITIAAASVIAKVTRDQMMYELDEKYPMYGFKNHKGYPTKKHLEALKEYGLIEGYRKTYGPVKEILERDQYETVCD